jgi:hypothetical protein
MSEKAYKYFLWEMIKSAAATADTDEKKEKFRQFMIDIILHLIPYKETQEELKERLGQVNIDYYINNGYPLIEYVVILKKDHLANKNIKEKPEEFGPCYWKIILHAAGYAFTKERQTKFRYFVLVILPYLIPCLLCSSHWIENLRKGQTLTILCKIT